ncbi:MAG TPA: DinB family protein [Gemmatimonadales bacterium]|nr:DinB family protein [Gemmatimonadales bacterium]
MTLRDALLPEFDQEMTTTRNLLERVPGDKEEWKPHPRSFSLGHLAQLISWMPGWMTHTLRETSFDFGSGTQYGHATTDALLAAFDRNVREARAVLAHSTDADLAVPWSLKVRNVVVLSRPRSAALRQHINHLIHHRGQLSVYLRLLEVPLPSIYGPTADEPWDPR